MISKKYKNLKMYTEDCGDSTVSIFICTEDSKIVQISSSNFQEIIKHCTIEKSIIKDELTYNDGVFYNESFSSYKKVLKKANFETIYSNLKIGQEVFIKTDSLEVEAVFVGILHGMAEYLITEENQNFGSTAYRIFKTPNRYIIAPFRVPKDCNKLMKAIRISDKITSTDLELGIKLKDVCTELNRGSPRDYVIVNHNSYLFSPEKFKSHDVDSNLVCTEIKLKDYTGEDPLIIYDGVYCTVFQTSPDECILNILYSSNEEPIRVSYNSIKDYDVHVYAHCIRRGYFKNESSY